MPTVLLLELTFSCQDDDRPVHDEIPGPPLQLRLPRLSGLEDQAGIWKLLKPEEIGVQLTEGFMMDPEASVSALVFHHPDCTYFGVGEVTESAGGRKLRLARARVATVRQFLAVEPLRKSSCSGVSLISSAFP